MATRGWEHVKPSDLQALKGRQTRRSSNLGQPDAITGQSGKQSKYRNVKVVMDGQKFDSRHEADCWLELRVRERAGELRNLKRQIRFPLYAPDLFRLVAETWVQVAEYVADFVYEDREGKRHVVDAKGQKRRICPYPLKKKWLALQEGIEIEEV